MNESYLASDDEIVLTLNSLSRAEYKSIQESIDKKKSLSIPITVNELAAIVNGDKIEPLPNWAKDKSFEQEIEHAIQNNEIVWLCTNCDKIVSFYKIPSGMPKTKYIIGLLEVNARNKTGCPFCQFTTTMLFSSDFLTTGEPIPEYNKEGKLESAQGETVSNQDIGKTSEQISFSGQDFTIDVLRNNINLKHDDKSQTFMMDNPLARTSYKDLSNIKTKYSTPIIEYLTVELSKVLYSMQNEKDFTLGLNKQSNKTLHRVWDSICIMLIEEWADIDSVDVIIVKKLGLMSQVFYEEHGVGVIVLYFDLFSILYELNADIEKILFHKNDADSLKAWIRHFMDMCSKITSNNEESIKERQISLNGEDILRSHFLGTSQQQFIILHELGHLASWKNMIAQPKKMKASIMDYNKAEMQADLWACQHIIEKGADFNVPSVQFLSIFLLFEYWNAFLKLKKLSYSGLITPRERWDNLYKFLKKNKKDTFSKQFIANTRNFFDTIIVSFTKEQIKEII
jgi:hypothetical protein